MSNQKQRNSLGIEMIEDLQKAINEIDYEKIRVLAISSSDPAIFSSGHNLKELTTENGTELHAKIFKKFTKLCLNLKNLPIPTIAEVAGLAAAAGLQLAASCDILIASNKASFSTPGVKFGVFCTTPGVALSRNTSQKLAAKMLFTGEAIKADEALLHGLVSEIVEPEKLELRVNEISKSISLNSRPVLKLGKKGFYEHIEKSDLSFAYTLAEACMLENLTIADTQMGLKSFANKKKPIWSHQDTRIKPS